MTDDTHDNIDFAALAASREVDQALAGARTLVVIMRGIYDEAISAGFTKTQAFQMAMEYQRTILTNMYRGGK